MHFDEIKIIVSFIAAFIVLLGIAKIRIFVRTGIKGSLLIGVSSVLIALGLILDVLSDVDDIFICVYFIINYIVFMWGVLRLSTVESGAWNELRSKNKYRVIFTGNVKGIEKKYYEPIINKRLGIFGSALFILAAPVVYVYSGSLFFLIYLLLTGIVLYILMRIYG
jgi:hypothetical protein